MRKQVHCGRGVVELNTVAVEHFLDTLELQFHDLRYLLLVEWCEHYNLVDTVQELRSYCLLEHVHHIVACALDHGVVIIGIEVLKALTNQARAQVAGHDDDGVLEVDGAALVVGEATVI